VVEFIGIGARARRIVVIGRLAAAARRRRRIVNRRDTVQGVVIESGLVAVAILLADLATECIVLAATAESDFIRC